MPSCSWAVIALRRWEVLNRTGLCRHDGRLQHFVAGKNELADQIHQQIHLPDVHPDIAARNRRGTGRRLLQRCIGGGGIGSASAWRRGDWARLARLGTGRETREIGDQLPIIGVTRGACPFNGREH